MAFAASSNTARLRVVRSPDPPSAGTRALGPIAELEDAQLVALARERDVQAFEMLYRRHAAFAMNLAVRIQGNASDVDDIVHDAFLRAHFRLQELRDTAAFRAWLGAIVVRLVRSRLRRSRILSAVGLGGADPVDLDSIASPNASPEIRAQLAQVYALLRTMPANDRIVWTLRFIEHHRLEHVAELAGCSLATAKRRIQRAQRFIADHFVAPFEAASPAGSMSSSALSSEDVGLEVEP